MIKNKECGSTGSKKQIGIYNNKYLKRFGLQNKVSKDYSIKGAQGIADYFNKNKLNHAKIKYVHIKNPKGKNRVVTPADKENMGPHHINLYADDENYNGVVEPSEIHIANGGNKDDFHHGGHV